MAPIVLLLRTVFEAILEVFLLCLAGYILARKGILDKRTQKQVNRLNVSLFTPSLLFSKVAFFLSPEKLRELWIIPIFFTLVTVVSMAVAHVLGWMFRLKRSQRNFAVAASMFMNSNSLPIALMQSLVITVPTLKWDDNDTEDAMVGRALTYLVLYSTLGMVLRWSYGVHLLAQADPEGTDMEQNGTEAHDDNEPIIRYSDEAGPREGILIDVENAEPPKMTGSPSATLTNIDGSINDQDNSTADQKERLLHPNTFSSFPSVPYDSTGNLSTSSSSTTLQQATDSPDSDDEPLLFTGETARRRSRRRLLSPSPRAKRIATRVWSRVHKAWNALNDFMTVPLWAAFLSLIVALVQPLQHTLDAHLQPIKGALSAAGNCSIPLTLVVLGAYFFNPPGKDNKDTLPAERPGVANGNASHQHDPEPSLTSSYSFLVERLPSAFSLSRLSLKSKGKGRSSRPGETKTVFIAVASRMLIVPLVFLPLLAVAAIYDVPKVFDDPVFMVSNILLISSPPALTLAQITQAASGDAFERLISRTIFWAYCVVTPPTTIIYVVIGIFFAKL